MNKFSSKNILMLIPKDLQETFLTETKVSSKTERGLIRSSQLGKMLTKELDYLKYRGYFVNGLAFDDTYNLEFFFLRHPKQTKEMKLPELKEEL